MPSPTIDPASRLNRARSSPIGTPHSSAQGTPKSGSARLPAQAADTVAQIVAHAAAPGQSLEDILRRLIFAALGAQQKYGPELYRHLEHVPNAVFRRRLTEAKRDLIDFMKALLEAHRQRLRVKDLDLAAFVVVNAAEGIGYNAGADLFTERLADEITTLLIRYLVDPRDRASAKR